MGLYGIKTTKKVSGRKKSPIYRKKGLENEMERYLPRIKRLPFTIGKSNNLIGLEQALFQLKK